MHLAPDPSPTHRAVARVFREESPRLVGGLVRIVRDLSLAEELAQDALVAALEAWPRSGIPDKPGAWLMTAAKNRALNTIRHARVRESEHDALARELESHRRLADVEAELEAGMDEDLNDDALRLVFAACHPVLPAAARVALTLRLVGGLTTDEIARAFLVPGPTMAQRLVRAKKSLADAAVPFEVPRGEALGERLASVLEVIYLIFNEGYAASSGDDVLRPALIDEALRLGALLTELAPAEPEVHGLLALMELAASRAPARLDARGEPILLADQDRALWDAEGIARGLASLERASARATEPGPYLLQASIAACHARAPISDATDWPRIAALYAELARVRPSPVVELNRAIAISRAQGPAAGLLLLDALLESGALDRYPYLPAARADLLERLGRRAEAAREFARAAGFAENTTQRERLLARASGARRGP